MAKLQFPAGFDFGVATSAFQIEGAWNEDGKGPSIWDTFGHTPGKVHLDIPGDRGADHYHRVKQDVALMREHKVDAFLVGEAFMRAPEPGEARARNPRGRRPRRPARQVPMPPPLDPPAVSAGSKAFSVAPKTGL